MKRLIFLALIASVTVGSVKLSAESLWQRRDRRSAYLFVDTRARQIGDLLTVVIDERNQIDNETAVDMDKETTTNGNFALTTTSNGNDSERDSNATITSTTGSNREMQADTSYSNARRFQDTMTVTVVDILPNGNLVIHGFRRRVIEGQARLMKLSGIVRANSIEIGNFVNSTAIANLQLNYEGSGTESRFHKQGWFSRHIMNRLWPF